MGAAVSVELQASERIEFRAGAHPQITTVTYVLQALPPDRAHIVFSSSQGVGEFIIIGDGVYSRQAATRGDLSTQRWAADTLDDLTQQLGTNDPFLVHPADTFTGLTKPTLIAGGSKTSVLGVRLGGGASDQVLKNPQVRLTVQTNSGQPQRLDINGVGYDPRYHVRINIDYTSWNQDLGIDVPDQTLPSGADIHPEDISNYHAAALFQPAAIPIGWALVTAKAVPAVPGNTTCDGIELDFATSDGTDNLQIYEVPAECAPTPPGSTPQAFGPNHGFTGHDPVTNTNGARLTLNQTGIVSYTTLGTAELVALLSDLEPLDLNHPPPDTLSAGPH